MDSTLIAHKVGLEEEVSVHVTGVPQEKYIPPKTPPITTTLISVPMTLPKLLPVMKYET